MTEETERAFKIVRREDLVPHCPHCGEELPEVYSKTKGIGFVQGQTVIFFCPHCLKVLGLGQNRMI